MNKHFPFSTTTTIQQRPPTSTATTSRNHRSITPTTSAHPNNNDKWPHHVTAQRMEDDNGRGQPGTSTDGDDLARQRMCHVVTVQVSMVTALPPFLFIRDTGATSRGRHCNHTTQMNGNKRQVTTTTHDDDNCLRRHCSESPSIPSFPLPTQLTSHQHQTTDGGHGHFTLPSDNRPRPTRTKTDDNNNAII